MINLGVFFLSSAIRTSHFILNTGKQNYIAFCSDPQIYLTICPRQILYRLGLERRRIEGKHCAPALLLPVVAGRRGSVSRFTQRTRRGACSTCGRAPRPPADGSVPKNCLQGKGLWGGNITQGCAGSGISTWLAHGLFCKCRQFARFMFSSGNWENNPCPALCGLARAALGSGLCGTQSSSCWSVLSVSWAQLHHRNNNPEAVLFR